MRAAGVETNTTWAGHDCGFASAIPSSGPWIGCGFYLGPFLGAQLQLGGGDVVFEVVELRCAGDREHDRGAMQEPGYGELRYRGLVVVGDLNERGGGGVVGLEELAAGHGIPGHEADAFLLAVF